MFKNLNVGVVLERVIMISVVKVVCQYPQYKIFGQKWDIVSA